MPVSDGDRWCARPAWSPGCIQYCYWYMVTGLNWTLERGRCSVSKGGGDQYAVTGCRKEGIQVIYTQAVRACLQAVIAHTGPKKKFVNIPVIASIIHSSWIMRFSIFVCGAIYVDCGGARAAPTPLSGVAVHSF